MVNTSDLTLFAKTFTKSAWMPGYNSAADLNADDSVNTSDLVLFARPFTLTVTGCAPGYPFYPTDAWTGTLQYGYNSNAYLIFPGAMLYSAGSYDCPAHPSVSGWAFISTQQGGGNLSACLVIGALETLAGTITTWHNGHGIPGVNIVYVGPNDCMANLGDQDIAAAASALQDVVTTANAYAQQYTPRLTVTAVVDNEGYFPPCGLNDTDESYCPLDDIPLFLGYHGPIGPAGGAPCSADDESTLSVDGGAPAIPQVYTFFGARSPSCSIDPWYDYLPNMVGAWPTNIASGYAGVESYPLGGPQGWPNGATAPFYSSWQANIRWSVCHGQLPAGAPPAVDFDWNYPGSRG